MGKFLPFADWKSTAEGRAALDPIDNVKHAIVQPWAEPFAVKALCGLGLLGCWTTKCAESH